MQRREVLKLLKWTEDELNLEQGMKLEWLETNGLGGYAAGTISGIRTRRYHGLLVAALRPPTQRTLLFAGTDEQINDGSRTHPLTAHLFCDGTVTQWTRPTEFALGWCPEWRYELPGASLIKRVFMPHMRNAVVIRYSVKASHSVELSVRLFFAWRDHHWTMQPFVPFEVQEEGNWLLIRAGQPSQITCYLAHNGAKFLHDGNWWHNFWLPAETERGLDDTESLFCVGTVVKTFCNCDYLDIIASVEPFDVNEVAKLEAEERERRKRLVSRVQGNELLATLFKASDNFIVLRSSTGTRTIIAGYPWFTDWGRDALISLPGLTLVTGRFAIAREILLTFAHYISEGMVPNFFPERDEMPAYNTVDATLWFVLAIYRYLRYTRDEKTLQQLWDALRSILICHLKGTRYKVCVDPEDGLLSWGSNSLDEALTWMDAKVWGKPITPRAGKPVEVNALWVNSLMILHHLANHLGDVETGKLALQAVEKAKNFFEPTFWNAEKGCLFDVITPGGVPDDSVRCNQLLALSLPFKVLSRGKGRSVLKVIERELLTPCGLRTLSPRDPRYAGRYIGPPHERDVAYHQGTVWVWWLGHYTDAVALQEGEKSVQRKIRPLLESFLSRHLREACVGQISEIFDGDEPHEPRGCFAQAWSVAEILRAWYERVEGNLPPPLWGES